ncbi:neprilysin-like protein, partial [Leptotrombidium deliense]
MKDQLKGVLRGLLETPINKNDSNATMNAKILYASCMNEYMIESRGAQPLLTLLNTLGGWPVLNSTHWFEAIEWIDLIAQLRHYNNDILISQWVGPDNKNSSVYVIQLDQPELGMPSREYYDRNTPQYIAYLSFMIKTAELLGADLDTATADMEAVLEFETKLADVTVPNEDRRNYSAIYRSFTVKKLQQMIPSIDWLRYLNKALPVTIHENETVVVYALDYIVNMVQLVTKTSKRTIINYILWRFIYHRSGNLDNRFIAVQQEYFK